ncbi:MAG: AI-2E family transporter [Lachnospiraceae bacterium]|nr:AI-2E family transporter [Lachnospiraceae bacterium]
MNLKNIKDEKWFPYTVAGCSTVLFFFLLQNINVLGTFFSWIGILISPLLVGVVIAYLINPIAMFVEKQIMERLNVKKKKIRWGASVGIAFILVALVLALLLVALIPSLVESITTFVSNLNDYQASFEGFLKKSDGTPNTDLNKTVDSLVDKLKDYFPTLTENLLSNSAGIGHSMTNFGLGIILAIYFLLDKSDITPWISRIFQKITSPENYKKLVDFSVKCNSILLRYISCSVLEAFLVGVANAVFMMISHMPFVALLSVVVGVTNLAPTFGPIIGCVIGMFILFLIKPIYALYFLGFTLVIQTLDGYVIKPKLFGNTLGVSSLWILISIICGGKMFGVVGVLFAIPFAAIVQYLLEEILFPKQDNGHRSMPWEHHSKTKKEDSTDTEEEE